MATLQSLTINDTGNITLPTGTSANRPSVTTSVQSFTSVGTTSWVVPAGVTQVEVLVVAGGGGGGNTEGNSGANAAGGGGGGVIYVSNYPTTPGETISVTVGGGGATQTSAGTWGNNGNNSVFGRLTAIGGGGGGADFTSSPFGSADPQRRRGRDGGSGGGGGFNARDPALGTPGQGHNGGLGGSYPNYGALAGGGGGAGEPGYDGTSSAPGRGGNGLLFSISGTPTYYAGGGGSGGNVSLTASSPGGLGGGGAGAPRLGAGVVSNGTPGSANTGGGGGGGCCNQGTTSTGGAGGSGIVIVRYSLANSVVPVGQTRLNTTASAVEYFNHNNRWNSSYSDNGIVTNGLMAHFDGRTYTGGSTWVDLSGNGNNGTLFNSPTYSATDGSFTFNGTNQYMQANINSTLLDGDPSFTAELFIKINSDFSSGSPWGIGGSGQGRGIGGWTPFTNRIHLDLYDSTRQDTLSKTYPLGQYIHLVWTKTGTGVQSSNIACYINGVLTSTTQTRSVTTGPNFNTSTNGVGVVLGRLNGDLNANYGNCTVGVYRVYSRALSYREVIQNYQAQCERFGLTKFSTTQPGASPLTAVPNPAALRSAGVWKDGAYWIQPYGQAASLTYVKFNFIDGNDWMLLMKVHTPGDMTSGSAFWTNALTYNDTDFNLNSGVWSKYGIWNTYTFNRLCMQMQARFFPIMVFNTGRTMFNFINGNSPGSGFAGYPCDSTDPAIGSNVLYDAMPMKIGNTIGTAQTGNERYVQAYGINCWANNSTNGTTDTRGFSALGRAGAWIGAPMDEGGHTFNVTSNSGSDSGIGFGGGAGNSTRTWSAGWGEWNSTVPIDSLPGYVWIR